MQKNALELLTEAGLVLQAPGGVAEAMREKMKELHVLTNLNPKPRFVGFKGCPLLLFYNIPLGTLKNNNNFGLHILY